MTRHQPALPQSVRAWPRNLLSLIVLAAATGTLYLQFSAEPDADDAEVAANAARLTAVVPIESGRLETADEPQAGSAQASVADVPREMPAGKGDGNTVLTGRMALLMNLLLIERGHARLKEIPDYTATFIKQERIGNELGEAQVIGMKLRHHPFSVYMKWYSCDKGRQVMYVDGENDGKMLVRVGGWKARLLPTLKIDPHGSRAMAESRHPITDAGLLEVARRSIAYRQRDLNAADGVRCRMLDNQSFDDRDCYCFIIEYDRPELSDGYRKVVAHVDKEYSLPVSVKNYGWPQPGAELADRELDERTLLEVYSYSELRLRAQLAEADFSRGNREYRFR